MVSARRFQFLVLACLASVLPATADFNHLVIAPQTPLLEIGTNFTATCMIINTAEVTADDLYWKLSKTPVPKEQYTRINSTALNVTVPITNEDPEWLFCLAKKKSEYVDMNEDKFFTGILLGTGYRPKKPENLSCKAVQDGIRISPTIKCTWDSASRSTISIATEYTLFVRQVLANETTTATTNLNSAEVTLRLFPNFMSLEIWVEAHNKLGRVESDHLEHEANYFAETKPPLDVKAIAEQTFPNSLLINWTHPIAKEHVEVRYQIRYCQHGSHNWSYVPLADTAAYIQSFRLQSLQPDTDYVVQVRCKHHKEDYGYWSDWSTNATRRTPEDRPRDPPSLWRTITEGDMNEQVQFICKDPEFPNGRITHFEIRIQHKVRNGSWEWESFPVNRSDSDSSSGQKITLLKRISLADKKSVRVSVTAVNSVGKSPDTSLGIPPKALELPPVENLKVWPHEGQLLVEWKPPNKPPNNTAPHIVTEYVVEWVGGGQLDWQKESRSTTHTAIKGNVERFVCYTVSVYPVYSTWIGKPARVEVYLEQGAPLKGPTVKLNGNPGRNEAELVWEEVPLRSRQGFITNYTIYYSSGTKVHDTTVLTAKTVPSNTTSYTLKSLSANTKYDIWIKASTIGGSTNGFNHSFTTAKYAPGEIEGFVVGVSLGFLFLVLLIMLLCIYKRDLIKENFWPQIPNPGESTIGHWSPDYPLKAETPKENCLSGISVLDVDMCDAKCVFEEDKAGLPLKKDKYLSEEHSSGIGGSSCMSSPRQSVSDSDEGGDMADTTSSTVQYSSVVASSGYKGQTPSSQPQQSIFSRSESTQPLLDSEENPDMLVQEGSRQFRHSPRQPPFTHSAGNKDTTDSNDFNKLEMEQQGLESLDFCPLEEDTEQTTPTDELSADWLSSAPASSYMPQLGGYRPQ